MMLGNVCTHLPNYTVKILTAVKKISKYYVFIFISNYFAHFLGGVRLKNAPIPENQGN
jgi:hypothetical protein